MRNTTSFYWNDTTWFVGKCTACREYSARSRRPKINISHAYRHFTDYQQNSHKYQIPGLPQVLGCVQRPLHSYNVLFKIRQFKKWE